MKSSAIENDNNSIRQLVHSLIKQNYQLE